MKRTSSITLEQETWRKLKSWMIINNIRRYEEAFKILLKDKIKQNTSSNKQTNKQNTSKTIKKK